MSELLTEKWRQDRLGKVTASRIGDMLARIKGGWGASRKRYAAELISERTYGVPYPHYLSPEMQYGIDTQDEALGAYEQRIGTLIHRCVTLFVPHPTIADAGCSPDGLVDDEGIVEVKCPDGAQHIDMLLGKPIDQRYLYQMQFQMACHPKRRWCDFVSYDNRVKPAWRLVIVRIHRAEPTIRMIEDEAVKFLKEVDDVIALIEARYPSVAVLDGTSMLDRFAVGSVSYDYESAPKSRVVVT